MAVFDKKGIMLRNGIHVERGQFFSSIRNLRNALAYRGDKNKKMLPSVGYIFKLLKELEVDERISCKICDGLGTLISVVNYEKYQGFYITSKEEKQQLELIKKDNHEHLVNTSRTLGEHLVNKNNKDNKDNKDIEINIPIEPQVADLTPYFPTDEKTDVKLTVVELQKLIDKFGKDDAIAKIINLDEGIKAYGYQNKYKSHYHTILVWARKDTETGKGLNNGKRTIRNDTQGHTESADYLKRPYADEGELKPSKAIIF